MNITEIRRENLRRWVAKNGTPAKEKSLFSQLKSNGSFGERVARRLEQQYKMGDGYLDLDPGAVATGPDRSSPFIDENSEVEGARAVRAGDPPDTVAIPRVKLRLRAGVAQFDTEPDLNGDGDEYIPRALLVAHGLDERNLLAVRVRGISMEPMLFEDDVVIVDKSSKSPINRELFAVNFDGEACVKQLVYRGNEWYLNSLNSDFGPVNVKSGKCSIIGRVVIQPTRVLTGRL